MPSVLQSYAELGERAPIQVLVYDTVWFISEFIVGLYDGLPPNRKHTIALTKSVTYSNHKRMKQVAPVIIIFIVWHKNKTRGLNC